MADFVQTMKDWRRMCENCDRNEKIGCVVNGSVCAGFRKMIDEIDLEVVEAKVTAWAAEHPVVYPMWCEWLADKGVVDVARMPVDYSGGIITEIKPSGKRYEPIPADLAQKLGIEPKEVK